MGMGHLSIDHAQVGQVANYIKNNTKNKRTDEEKQQSSVDIKNSDLSAFRRIDGGVSFYGNIMPNNVSLKLIRQNSGIDIKTTSFEDTIKSAKEYFISQGLKTEGWCPPENYSDVHSAIILSKYYNFSIGTTGQRFFSGEARFITASTNRWYIPRHGLDNTEGLEYALTLLEEAVKNKKHLALYAHDTASTDDRDRLLDVIKDYVDKGQLVVVDANTQFTSLLKTWRNNISVNKPVFPFVGSAYFDNVVKVCTNYGTRERIKISFTGTATNGVITLKEYTTTLFRSENIDNEVEGTSYSNKPWSVNTTDGMSIQDICTSLASIHLTCHTMINMGDHLIVESDIPRKWTNTISVSENTSGLKVNIEVLEYGVNPIFQ